MKCFGDIVISHLQLSFGNDTKVGYQLSLWLIQRERTVLHCHWVLFYLQHHFCCKALSNVTFIVVSSSLSFDSCFCFICDECLHLLFLYLWQLCVRIWQSIYSHYDKSSYNLCSSWWCFRIFWVISGAVTT